MDKINRLKEILLKYNSAIIAFSGGVDSTFLARVAKDIYGERLLLVTASSSTLPVSELNEAKELAKKIGAKHDIIQSKEIEIPGFKDNPPDRCYYCKTELFNLIKEICNIEGYEVVFDGSNFDDTNDFRPGRKALKELGIVSPLKEAGLTKKDIRECSIQYNLSTADKPSYACLASRFPYGEKISKDKLKRVEKAEDGLKEIGFKQFRVRSHHDLARIELAIDEIERGWQMRNELENICKNAGFTYVAVDISGYRMGAMNEILSKDLQKKMQ